MSTDTKYMVFFCLIVVPVLFCIGFVLYSAFTGAEPPSRRYGKEKTAYVCFGESKQTNPLTIK